MDSIISEYKTLTLALVSNPQLRFDNALHSSLPEEGGVYRIFERGAAWQSSVYVGETANLLDRIYSGHLMGNRKASTLKKKLIDSGRFSEENAVKEYLQERCLVQYVTIADQRLQSFFEHFAVNTLKPQFND